MAKKTTEKDDLLERLADELNKSNKEGGNSCVLLG